MSIKERQKPSQPTAEQNGWRDEEEIQRIIDMRYRKAVAMARWTACLERVSRMGEVEDARPRVVARTEDRQAHAPALSPEPAG